MNQDDGVGPEEWARYEYARVRRFHAPLGLRSPKRASRARTTSRLGKK